MLVKFKRVLFGELPTNSPAAEKTYEVKEIDVTFCCADMTDAWSTFVGFGEADGVLNREETVNIYTCHPYPEGAVWDSCSIKVCPFCAEPIEVVEGERVRLKRQTKKRTMTQTEYVEERIENT